MYNIDFPKLKFPAPAWNSALTAGIFSCVIVVWLTTSVSYLTPGNPAKYARRYFCKDVGPERSLTTIWIALKANSESDSLNVNKTPLLASSICEKSVGYWNWNPNNGL